MGIGGLDEELGRENGYPVENGIDSRPGSETRAEITPVRKRRAFHLWNVDGQEYKLKLNTAMIGKLENKYRTNILNLVSDSGIPPLSVMLTIVQAAMDPWHHGMSYANVQKMYDRWLEQGGNQMEFFTGIVMPTMAVSGFFTEKQTEAMMESLKDADTLL